MEIFYNSSMPRSGSTLLQNIIAQNPDFHCSPTSGLLELIYGARKNYSDCPEFKAQNKDEMSRAFLSFCGFGMLGYYNSITNKPYVMDKSRGWGIHYNFLNLIHKNILGFREPKIVCVVRDLREIITSMEKKFRQHGEQHSEIVNHGSLQNTTTFKRVNYWLSTPPVGLAIDRVQEILMHGTSKVLFIRYEDLLTHPNEVMVDFYRYLEIKEFKHNFNNIVQITQEDDDIYGIYGDHKIKEGPLSPLKYDYPTILGDEISNYIKTNFKWYFDIFKYE